MGGKLGIVTKLKCPKCGVPVRGKARRILRRKTIKCWKCRYNIPPSFFKLSLKKGSGKW